MAQPKTLFLKGVITMKRTLLNVSFMLSVLKDVLILGFQVIVATHVACTVTLLVGLIWIDDAILEILRTASAAEIRDTVRFFVKTFLILSCIIFLTHRVIQFFLGQDRQLAKQRYLIGIINSLLLRYGLIKPGDVARWENIPVQGVYGVAHVKYARKPDQNQDGISKKEINE